MSKSLICIVLLAVLAFAAAENFFLETFSDGDKWTSRWVNSKHKKDGSSAGPWKLTHGKFYGDAEEDVGIQTGEDARFYWLTAKSEKPFTNEGKTLVLQFSVKNEQNLDCGGGYIKLLPADVNQADFHGDSEYAIMFGPDICGTSTKKIHVIFNYEGKNHLIKKEIAAETDQLTHVYTLIVNPDNTYEVRVDGKKKESGSLLEDFDMLPPKTIKDPKAVKPSDWDDRPKIDDPEDKKPEDWDKTPKEIADPDATKPEDWDDEADGEWEAPQIPNPEYKGEWKPKQIKNPDYKGKWVHPEIPNPDFTPNDKLYAYKSLGAVGFDLWQVKSGSIFDNIIVTDDIKAAEKLLDDTWGENHENEKKMFDEQEKKRREEDEARRKKDEEERKAREAAEKDDESDASDSDSDEEDSKKKGHDEL